MVRKIRQVRHQAQHLAIPWLCNDQQLAASLAEPSLQGYTPCVKIEISRQECVCTGGDVLRVMNRGVPRGLELRKW